MSAIVLCMKKRGIRFFSKIKFPNISTSRYYGRNGFLGLLNSRRKHYDNVLIMAHGASHCILTTTHDPCHEYEEYITLDDTRAFINDFVFAVSCDTANEFGKKCIENGAIAYLGYLTKISFLFSVKLENAPKRVTTNFDIIVKRIFIEELSRAFEEFMQKPISVKLMRERFCFFMEARISRLLDMSTDEIFGEYNVKFSKKDYCRYIPAIRLKILSHLDETSERLVCLGDENFISDGFILSMKKKGTDTKDIRTLIENNKCFMNLGNVAYKGYLLAKIDE